MDSVLRPRDIQTRIRSGESPESVAEAAGTTVEKIMGFAAPVMAERAYVAQQAEKASVRRRAGDGPVGHLGEAVTATLRAAKIDVAAAEWDAWRRDDGRWTVVVDYPSDQGDQRAEFVYDSAGRYVTAENDQSRWLVGERAASGDRPERARRLSSVQDEQLPLGDDAIEVVTGRRPTDPALELDLDPAPEGSRSARLRPVSEDRDDQPVGDDSLTEDLGEVAEVLRPARSGRAVDADWISTQASDRPEAPTASSEPDAQPGDAGGESPAEPSPGPDQASRKKPAKGKGRASVPSWDEIMFGAGRND